VVCSTWRRCTFSAIGQTATWPSSPRARITEISRANGTTASTTAGSWRSRVSAASPSATEAMRTWPLPS
jgi:hypothetical protein